MNLHGEDKIWYLYRSAGRGADKWSGTHGGGRRQAALSLLLVYAIALGLRQLQEVLHGAQVDQQRLGRRLRVFLLAQDLRQQALHRGVWGEGRPERSETDGEWPRLVLK